MVYVNLESAIIYQRNFEAKKGRGQSLSVLPEKDTPWSIGVMDYWSVDPW
jgi:hypothetical protein